jgi:hypothetical protein
MIQHRNKALALALSLALSANLAHADEREDLEVLRQTTINLINALVSKGVLTEEVAKDLIKAAEDSARSKVSAQIAAEATQPKTVRVPYIPEVVKKEIREQLRQEIVAQAKEERWGDVNAVPDWVGRMKWEGDLRVRYQKDLFASSNAVPGFYANEWGATPGNTTQDQDRWRVRARLGLLAKISDSVSAGFRITSGNLTDPVSTNQTVGQGFNKYSLVLDRAYLKLDPWDWLSVSGGRIPNPFFSTDLVWDDDLNFEGLAATFKPWAIENRALKPFVTVGAFPLQQVESSISNLAKDKWLYGAQAGLDWRQGNNSRWRFGLAYYDYVNVKGVADTVADGVNPYAETAPRSRQKGNSVFDLSPDDNLFGLAADYHLLNFTAVADLAQFDPIHIILSGDVVKNLGYNTSQVASVMGTGYAEKTLGWNAKLTLGRPNISQPGEWQAFLGYRHLERDAVPDFFTDSDFALGGTNNKGYYLGGLYGLDKNTWLSLRWLSADSIDGTAFGVDTVQLDMNAKF